MLFYIAQRFKFDCIAGSLLLCCNIVYGSPMRTQNKVAWLYHGKEVMVQYLCKIQIAR